MFQERDKSTIIIVARQAGTANAFSPIIKAVSARGSSLAVLAFGAAYEAWKSSGITAIEVDSFSEAESILNGIPKPVFMLTGTSLAVIEDAYFWDWARRRAVASLAFVDQWVNYWQRFTTDASGAVRFDAVPDKIAVIDRIAEDRMVEAGCPEHLLLVTGSPAFDGLWSFCGITNYDVRARFGPSSRLVLFVSEPRSRADTLGYTDDEVLALTLTALEEIGRDRKVKFGVAVKRHPMEGSEVDESVLERARGYKYVTAEIVDGPRHELVKASDVVVGMTSLLLYEAAVMGRPVVSIQPNRLSRSDLTDARPGIEVVTRARRVRPALESAFSTNRGGPSDSPLRAVSDDATSKFLSYVDGQIKQQKSE